MRFCKLFSSATLCSLAAAAAVLPEVAVQHDERQIGGALECLVGGILVLLQELLTAADATTYCQAYLGLNTTTILQTKSVTVAVTKTNYVTTGTQHLTVTAPPVTNVLSANGPVVTTCLSTTGGAANVLTKRQVAVTTPSAIAGLPPATICLLCVCLDPPTPSTTVTVTQTATSTVQATVNLLASDSVTVTPTVTVVTTVASTVNYCPIPTVPPTTCNNAGLQWAYWSDPTLSLALNPSALHSTAPLATGVANPATQAGVWAGVCAPGATTTFFGTALPCTYFAFQFRGYLYAPVAGTYNFGVFYADDLLSIWVGSDASGSGWYSADSRSPELSNRGPVTYSYTAAAGEYIPVRILLNQATGPYGEGVAVTGPGGQVFLGGSGPAVNWVQFACDGSTGTWLPWGAE